ncbi:MAG: hypothetical protein GQ562_09820 [Anaerolineales bacterium]|nr:hypothetical protein [Anaerolineales bacterium]
MITKPGKVQTISILVLISGILNVFGGGLLALLIIIGTLGIGILCAPVLILPMILGVVEIVYGINLLSDPPKVKELSQPIAILEICSILFANVFAVVVGIISLVFLNDDEVKSYFSALQEAEG